MGYYFLLVMIKLPYEQGRTRSLNKIEICFSPARCPKESRCVRLFSMSSGTQIAISLLSHPWGVLPQAAGGSGSKGKWKDRVAIPPADGFLILLPGSSTHTSAQHLSHLSKGAWEMYPWWAYCHPNLVQCYKGKGKLGTGVVNQSLSRTAKNIFNEIKRRNPVIIKPSYLVIKTGTGTVTKITGNSSMSLLGNFSGTRSVETGWFSRI